jgi:cyclopropane-fatty-acyl-phospholipid synthase
MNTTTLAAPALTTRQRLCRKAMLARLTSLSRGTLTIRDQDATYTLGKCDPRWPDAVIDVVDGDAWVEMVLGGSIGAAEAYAHGCWTTPQLTDVIRVMVLNMDVLDAMEGGLATLTAPALRAAHWLHRNTQKQARRNIAAHYDLGNDFFRLFLDPTMMYSAAIFRSETDTLEQASLAKLDHICRKLRLQPEDHLVEIGTGWGSMAIHAAKHYGCRVTTTTISENQYAYAIARIAALGLSDRITVVREDYRNLQGKFDKLVSIEMIEAVGHEFYDSYFQTIERLLLPHGLALVQAITIADHRYERALRNVDFIQKYIFPGSCIPSITALQTSIGNRTRLKTVNLEDITPHYAITLNRWCEAFMRNADEIRRLGFDDVFIRLWQFYFCYCEGGFAERVIGDVQWLMAMPDARHDFLPANPC